MAKKWKIHAIMECTNPTCNFSAQDYTTAQRKASEHARRTGHTVKGEVAYAFTYFGKDPK